MPDIGAREIVVPPDLQVAGQQLTSRAQAIVDELEALKVQLQPLVDTWVGPAASYYFPLQQEWNIAADGLFGPTGVLGHIANAMNVTWNNYTECEWSNVRGWQR